MKFFRNNIFNISVFLFLTVCVFLIFSSLFSSYFEADEWAHFAYYFPLTKHSTGLLTAFLSTFINSNVLSGGQHIVPLASVIFYLNTKFFGLNYVPYALITLILHSLNSFLVFLLIKIFLSKKEQLTKNVYGLLGGIFFAFNPVSVHAITGAAPFYGQNILSVTAFLFCLIFFKLSFIKKDKKFIYFSTISLFISLFTKETSVFIFFLLPLIAVFEKKIFSTKYLLKLLAFTLSFYVVIRFFIPFAYSLPQLADRWIGDYVHSSQRNNLSSNVINKTDTGTVVSSDISIYKNLPLELLYRSISFPLKMVGTIFVPRSTLTSVLQVITPFVYPSPPGGDGVGQLSFITGAGNYIIIYFVSLVIVIFCLLKIVFQIRKKQIQDAQVIFLGFTTIVLSALPLVAITFSFPRWGYDIYFDSRFYYNPSVGAAILFPFLLISISEFSAKYFKLNKIFIGFVLFSVWLVYTLNLLFAGIAQFVNVYSFSRREVIRQFKEILPILPKRTVFYVETDGQSAYGSALPFLTSVPQAILIGYYAKDPMPDGFFNQPLFNSKQQGYQFMDTRGFGYYTSKKSLSDAILAGEFSVDDIYSFYYFAGKGKLEDNTSVMRNEMKSYLEERKKIAGWKLFESLLSNGKISFLYSSNTEIVNVPFVSTEASLLKEFEIRNPDYLAEFKIISSPSALDANNVLGIFGKLNNSGSPVVKKVAFDKYHFNNAFYASILNTNYYILQFDKILVVLTTQSNDQKSLEEIEMLLGSVTPEKNM